MKFNYGFYNSGRRKILLTVFFSPLYLYVVSIGILEKKIYGAAE